LQLFERHKFFLGKGRGGGREGDWERGRGGDWERGRGGEGEIGRLGKIFTLDFLA
jgi:hypothetical protein